jgi:hypothetical protein
MSEEIVKSTTGNKYVFCRHYTRNGKVIYHPTGGVFRFQVKVDEEDKS